MVYGIIGIASRTKTTTTTTTTTWAVKFYPKHISAACHNACRLVLQPAYQADRSVTIIFNVVPCFISCIMKRTSHGLAVQTSRRAVQFGLQHISAACNNACRLFLQPVYHADRSVAFYYYKQLTILKKLY